jgi:chorismate synthase
MPAGIGSNRQPADRLDACLAAALMGIQTVKAVEVGDPLIFGRPGSESHDTFAMRDDAVVRASNRAGGIEGGMSNGEDIVIRARLKPLSTLRKPLDSVDLATGASAPATVVRSDVCAVPAASIIGEAMICLALAPLFAEKYGGDSVSELVEHFTSSQQGAAALFDFQ